MANIQTIKYSIQKGDNLTKIAKKYNTTVQEILNYNQYIKDPNLIYIGNELVIPESIDSVDLNNTTINNELNSYTGTSDVPPTDVVESVDLSANSISNKEPVDILHPYHLEEANNNINESIEDVNNGIEIPKEEVKEPVDILHPYNLDNSNNVSEQQIENIDTEVTQEIINEPVVETSSNDQIIEDIEDEVETPVEQEDIIEEIPEDISEIEDNIQEIEDEIPEINTSEQIESIANEIEDSNINEMNDINNSYIDDNGLVHYESGYVSPFKVTDDTRISSHVGFRVAPETSQGHGSSNHKGMDIAVPIGTEIHSINSGVVINAGNATGFGKWVQVQQDDGNVVTYGHVSNASIVSVGQRVEAGDVVAISGNEGNSSGPHLHLQVNKGDYHGEVIDPEYYLR